VAHLRSTARGRWLASSLHALVHRYDAAQVVASVLDPTGQVFAVATRVGKGTSSAILSARTGRTIARLQDTGIRSFAFSSDGRLLASGSYDRTARIWNARTGRLLHVLKHQGYVLAERFSSDGKSLVTSSSDGAAYLWDVANGQRQLLLVGATGAAQAAAFSPDGSEIAVASADRLARIYYSQDGRLLAPLAGHRDAVTSIGFDPSGRTIVTGSSDGSARLWDALPQGTLRPIDKRRSAVETLFARTDPISVAGHEARILTTSGRVIRRLTMPTTIIAAAARGATIVLADRSGDVLVDRHGAVRMTRGLGVTAVAVQENGKVVLGRADGGIGYSGANSVFAGVGAPVAGLSTGGDTILARERSGKFDVLTETSQGGTVSGPFASGVRHAALSPDGATVVTTRGKNAQLWDASTGKLLHTLTGHRSLVADAEFSPNGRELVTVSDDHTGRIWSVRSGRLLRVLVGHFFPVRTGSYSPDGHWIVTASQLTAGLWNAGTGQLLFYLGRDTKPLTGASFSPSGNWILTGSNDGTARVYHCVICEPLAGLEATAEARIRALR